MGLETMGSFDQINKAVTIGIATVFHPIFAARAEVMTGAIINATTAGRIPLNIELIVSLFLIKSGVRNIAIVNIIKNEGKIVPNAATMLPRFPRILSPTATDILTANMPGNDCATASKSRKSSLPIHRCFSTISFSMIDIIAHPPPKVKAPILKNVINN